MIGQGTWVQFVNTETRNQSRQWVHTQSPSNLRKQSKNNGCSVLGSQGDFFKGIHASGTAGTSGIYCETFSKLQRSIKNRRHGVPVKGYRSPVRQRASLHCKKMSKLFSRAVQRGDFRPSPYSLDSAPKPLPSPRQEEGLVGYPALRNQRVTHRWNKQLSGYPSSTVL